MIIIRLGAACIGLAAGCVSAAALATSSDAGGQTAATQPASDAAAPTPAKSDPSPPRGMERYAHPILKDGRLVLWHGAWRDRLRAKAKAEATARPAETVAPSRPTPLVAAPRPAPVIAPAAAIAAPAAQTSASPTPAGSHQFTVLADMDDACASRMAGEFAALHFEGAGLRVLPGHVTASAIAADVANDGADFVIAPFNSLLANPQASAGWRDRAPYIARLAAEPIEIIAARDVTDIRQLAGRDVGYGSPDSAAASSATILFGALGVAPRPVYAPLASQLADLSAGKLAAIVVVDGRCSKAIAAFGEDHRYHEVAVRWSPALEALYVPARLTAKDRPNLIEAEEKIDTVETPRALFALDAAPDTPRAEAAATLTKNFFNGFDRLLEPDKDAAWRSVNLAASAPWPRLKAAQTWVNDAAPAPNSSLEAFRSAARGVAAGSDGPAPQDSDRLFDSLMHWRGAAQ